MECRKTYNYPIGNDIPITWRIKRFESSEDLSRAVSLKLQMIGSNGIAINVTGYTLDDNAISWIFRGKDQTTPASYVFKLVGNEGLDNMFTVKTCAVLRLVPAACMSDNPDGMLPLDITSEIIVPANGLSAYEIAVLHGFKGTEQEWLAFLGTGVRYVEVVLDRDYVIPASPCPGGEVLYCILVGSAVHSVTAEEGVRWLNGILPVPEAESTLVVSVVNNLAVWGTFR